MNRSALTCFVVCGVVLALLHVQLTEARRRGGSSSRRGGSSSSSSRRRNRPTSTSSSGGNSRSSYPKQGYTNVAAGSGGTNRNVGGNRNRGVYGNTGTNIGAGGWKNPGNNRGLGYTSTALGTGAGSYYGRKPGYSYGNSYRHNYYGNNYFGQSRSSGVFGGGGKSFALGAGAGFVGGAMVGMAGMGVYHRYLMYQNMIGGGYGGYGGGYGRGYGGGYGGGYSAFGRNRCFGGCPIGAFCDFGICRCPPAQDTFYGNCYEDFGSQYGQRRSYFDSRRQRSFNPHELCSQHSDCWKVDMNMVCGAETAKCQCRENMKWNEEVGECQVFMDVDCSDVTELKRRRRRRETDDDESGKASLAANETSGGNGTEKPAPVNVTTPDVITVEGAGINGTTITINIQQTLEGSQLANIDPATTSKEDIKATFCREIGDVSQKYSLANSYADVRSPPRNVNNGGDWNNRSWGWGGAGYLGPALFALGLFACGGCCCCIACLKKKKDGPGATAAAAQAEQLNMNRQNRDNSSDEHSDDDGKGDPDDIICDGCEKDPVIGTYFHCLNCEEYDGYDLCPACYSQGIVTGRHHISHQMQQLITNEHGTAAPAYSPPVGQGAFAPPPTQPPPGYPGAAVAPGYPPQPQPYPAAYPAGQPADAYSYPAAAPYPPPAAAPYPPQGPGGYPPQAPAAAAPYPPPAGSAPAYPPPAASAPAYPPQQPYAPPYPNP